MSLRLTLKNEDDDVRWAAATALGRIGDPRAAASFIAAFKDDKMRKYAIEMLVEIGTAAVNPLVTALTDTDAERDIRSAAATALGSSIMQPVPIIPSVSYSGPMLVMANSAGSSMVIRRWHPMGQYLHGSGLACSVLV